MATFFNSYYSSSQSKSEIPYFNGESVDRWLDQVEKFYSRYQTCSEKKFADITTYYLTGEALEWYRQWQQEMSWRWFRLATWEDFVRDIRTHFKPQEAVNLSSPTPWDKTAKTIADFSADFERFEARLAAISARYEAQMAAISTRKEAAFQEIMSMRKEMLAQEKQQIRSSSSLPSPTISSRGKEAPFEAAILTSQENSKDANQNSRSSVEVYVSTCEVVPAEDVDHDFDQNSIYGNLIKMEAVKAIDYDDSSSNEDQGNEDQDTDELNESLEFVLKESTDKPKVTSEIPSIYCPTDALLQNGDFVNGNAKSVVENREQSMLQILPENFHGGVLSRIAINGTPAARRNVLVKLSQLNDVSRVSRTEIFKVCMLSSDFEIGNVVIWVKKPPPEPPDDKFQWSESVPYSKGGAAVLWKKKTPPRPPDDLGSRKVRLKLNGDVPLSAVEGFERGTADSDVVGGTIRWRGYLDHLVGSTCHNQNTFNSKEFLLLQVALRPGASDMLNGILRKLLLLKEQNTLPKPKAEGDDCPQSCALATLHSRASLDGVAMDKNSMTTGSCKAYVMEQQ